MIGGFHPVPKPDPRKKKNRSGSNQKERVREQVRERDGDYCMWCGIPGPGLHLHRIVYGSQMGRYEPENCVLLCVTHHQIIHSDKKYWQPRLLSYVSSKGAQK